MKEKLFSYLPGLVLFVIALGIGLYAYQDYGISWDEPLQRGPGLLSYNYMFHGSQELFLQPTDNHGAGFELLLVIIEKSMRLTDSRDIYLMRHLVSHIFFLLSVLSAYFLIIRLFNNKFLACLCFIMLAFAPRIYAHSYFNSKDIPFYAMILFSLSYCQIAFEKNKPIHFFILGLLCGYATSIRIMGVLLVAFIFLFIAFDVIAERSYADKKALKKQAIKSLVFLVGFVFTLYISWPFLWKSPVNNFIDSFVKLSHFDWDASTLMNGMYVRTTDLPWTYFPTWFLVTTPILWIVIGLIGLWTIIKDFLKKPGSFLTNRKERNHLLYLLWFFTPVLAVIMLKSVIYDDWRHLYFVYPAFVLAGIYGLNKMLLAVKKQYQIAIMSICVIQIAMVGNFMVTAHPFQQVYFNELVPHTDEYLRENYDLEYWGCGFKQGLDHLVSKSKTDTVRVACNYNDPLINNVMILQKQDRARIKLYQITEMGKADYFITNFRGHREDYPSKNIEYSVKVLNSTVLCVFKLKKN